MTNLSGMRSQAIGSSSLLNVAVFLLSFSLVSACNCHLTYLHNHNQYLLSLCYSPASSALPMNEILLFNDASISKMICVKTQHMYTVYIIAKNMIMVNICFYVCALPHLEQLLLLALLFTSFLLLLLLFLFLPLFRVLGFHFSLVILFLLLSHLLPVPALPSWKRV